MSPQAKLISVSLSSAVTDINLLRRDAYASAVLVVEILSSVRLSDACTGTNRKKLLPMFRYIIKDQAASFLTPPSADGGLFLTPKILVQCYIPCSKQRWLPQIIKNIWWWWWWWDYRWCSSAVTAEQQVQLSLIGSQPWAFQLTQDELCTLKVAQRRKFTGLWIKLDFYRTKSATKFLCQKSNEACIARTHWVKWSTCTAW